MSITLFKKQVAEKSLADQIYEHTIKDGAAASLDSK